MADAFQSPLLTLREAAEYLRISHSTLEVFKRKGLIKTIRLGGAVRVHRDELERILREGL
ncbi:Helix-turn-helix domain protein [Planctomycetes bacterium MalM25]|nr:Helix-turn-helix domain protein [Planctomycetes bacterium MalM25]